MNGLNKAGMATSTFALTGTRSTAFHIVHQRPLQAPRRRGGAPCRGDGVRPKVARDDKTPARRQPAGVPARERCSFRERHVGERFFQPGGCHDLALDPGTVGFPGHGFDHQAQKPIAVVRVLEARAAADDRRRFELCAKLRVAEEGPAVHELTVVGAVAPATS
jgi:hypothetical protein